MIPTNRLAAIAVFVKALVLVAGAGVTAVAYRAYRRTRAAALRSLAAGFGLLIRALYVSDGRFSVPDLVASSNRR